MGAVVFSGKNRINYGLCRHALHFTCVIRNFSPVSIVDFFKINSMVILYGIPNCDVTKKAIKWLDEHKVSYTFHNYKTDGITESKLQEWCRQVSWEKLLNKKGTTFKNLHPAIQANATNEKAAIEIMTAQTSTIKRPVIEKNHKVAAVGFNASQYEIAFL